METHSMRLEEFDAFKGELKQLCATLGKAYTDALAEAYWRSLRDVDLDEVQSHVERILLNANRDTKFPKPAQLRSALPTTKAVPEPSLREAESLAIRNLEELRRTNPEEWMNRLKGRRAVEYAEQFGIHNIWFDFDQRCWRHHP